VFVDDRPGQRCPRADRPILLRPALPLENVAFLGNFWDARPEGDDDPPTGVVYAANTVLPGGAAGDDGLAGDGGQDGDVDGDGFDGRDDDGGRGGTDGLPPDIVAAAGRRAWG
jgi:hypothetical protein